MRLLFITSNRLGDAVMSTGLLAALLDQHPGCRATVVCGPLPAPIFRHAPGVEAVITLHKRRYSLHWLTLWSQLVTRRWDIIVDLRNSLASSMLRRGRLIRLGAHKPGLHVVEELASLIEASRPTPPAFWPRLWIGPEDQQDAERLLPAGRPVLALGPAANWPAKQWPVARFIALADRLTAPDGPLPGAAILVSAAQHERAVVEPVLAHFGPRCIDMIGAPVMPTAAAFARSQLYIGNDSGLMHIAAAAGTPTLGLFGPTDEIRYHPWGAPGGPHARLVRTPEDWRSLITALDSGQRPGERLMDGIAVEAAEQAALDLLANKP
ncbi:MAG: glycosyltransferase family 9 protein [Alphaproteobacteria bacterium]|nr:glycosyltransferase family 9 protein [Alphaproteobacteria bacterium]MBU0797626.1 glycosyltransferase family 9 protein [Alphaproteobacteria bacterium]MBU0889128.1 glycosyltransferase family 9 protein [Alphaproteobacteria bacterium]MBU1812162.1 glycosyltransferase family 9 protein [Alphaproteobacteria bacterium]